MSSDDSAAGDPTQPRPEHPRPHLYRERWLNLNGTWDFEIDRGDSGVERGLHTRPLSDRIVVPFAPESTASGIGETDFLEAVWYRRRVRVPAEWSGQRLLLHFGAVDYDTTVWVDGTEVGRHRGGFASFTLDLGVRAGAQFTVTVRARDSRHGVQPRGKQSRKYGGYGPLYGRTTGIWQTVWVEAVPPVHLLAPRITPQVSIGTIEVDLPTSRRPSGWHVRAILSDDAGEVVRAEAAVGVDMTPRVTLAIPPARRTLWQPGRPHLYPLRLELLDADGEVVDGLDSYAALRSVSIDGRAVLINGERVFQRLVLDQGYWADTLMTAPSDQALVRDIELSMAAGFNGARLHEKVFEERFLFHADRLGYLVWGEFGDWGAKVDGPSRDRHRPTAAFVGEWVEVLRRDHNHPSIVGWCPLNETYQRLTDRPTALDDATHAMFWATKAIDPSRPVIDASGYAHRVPQTDVYDSHTYAQNPRRLAKLVGRLADDDPFVNSGPDDKAWSVPYAGQPYMVSEFGGIWWNPSASAEATGQNLTESWGYGTRVRGERDFLRRLEGLFEVLLDDPDMFGYCYTQLTDVFHEENGVYAMDRTPKFDVTKLAAIQARTTAYERTGPTGSGAQQ